MHSKVKKLKKKKARSSSAEGGADDDDVSAVSSWGEDEQSASLLGTEQPSFRGETPQGSHRVSSASIAPATAENKPLQAISEDAGDAAEADGAAAIEAVDVSDGPASQPLPAEPPAPATPPSPGLVSPLPDSPSDLPLPTMPTPTPPAADFTVPETGSPLSVEKANHGPP